MFSTKVLISSSAKYFRVNWKKECALMTFTMEMLYRVKRDAKEGPIGEGLKFYAHRSVWYVLSISSTSLHIRFTECFISVQILTWVVSIVFGFVFRCEIIRVSKKPSGLFVVFGCFKPWPNEKTPSKHYCKTFEIGLPYQGFLPK